MEKVKDFQRNAQSWLIFAKSVILILPVLNFSNLGDQPILLFLCVACLLETNSFNGIWRAHVKRFFEQFSKVHAYSAMCEL